MVHVQIVTGVLRVCVILDGRDRFVMKLTIVKVIRAKMEQFVVIICLTIPVSVHQAFMGHCVKKSIFVIAVHASTMGHVLTIRIHFLAIAQVNGQENVAKEKTYVSEQNHVEIMLIAFRLNRKCFVPV